MILDYLFIVFNFIYIIYMVVVTSFYSSLSGVSISYKTDFFLNSFKEVKVNNFLLPNFNELNREEKLDFIYRNIKNIQIYISQEDIDLISLINDFREKNNIQILSMSKSKKLPSYIINPLPEMILFSYKNIFSKTNKYLFRYPKGEFENIMLII